MSTSKVGGVEPAWLDEREMRAWRGFNRMRAELTARLARQLGQEAGLTWADYEVLVRVSEAPGRRIRARDLGRSLRWERSRLSRQIARMEARGTVERAPCEGDARGFDVILTDAGLAAIQAAATMHLTAVRHCFADLLTPQQLDVFGDIAETVTNHLAAEHADVANGEEE
jgi:DNA-binding MarR family transcriptional regulator